MLKEKMRVYVLARELNIDSKDLLDICRQAGLEVKNQLSSLEPEQCDQIVKLIQKKGSASAPVAAPPASPPPLAAMGKVRVISAPAHPQKEAAVSVALPTPQEVPPVAEPQPDVPVAPAAAAASVTPPAVPPVQRPEVSPSRVRTLTPLRPRQIGTPGGASSAKQAAEAKEARPQRPRMATLASPPRAKPPASLRDDKKTEQPAAQKPLMKLPEGLKGKNLSTKELVKEVIAKAEIQQLGAVPVEEDEEAGGHRRPGAVKGREDRHKRRTQRATVRKQTDETGPLRLRGVDDDEDGRQGLRLLKRNRQAQLKKGPQKRQGKVPIEPPITVRSLSEAIGLKASEILRKLMDRGQMLSINTMIDASLAEEIAIEQGVELEIKKAADAEEAVVGKALAEDKPEDMAPRAPIVTVMGHVDHGKTSLLDRIRESNVVATEAGGITQHLRAWRVEHKDRPITFLDTPGHEAFTQMRARGAQVTDIVVLVVAADDGVMPQTEEAISHAKAAGVPMIVAINKVDLPNANLNKTRQQLYGLELIPDDMGGDTPFVETVATKDRARGIEELLEKINLVADLMLELKANPNRPGVGICLEAKLSEGEGVVATLLVQNGTLRRGDAMFCGTTFGRVRAMYDEHGNPLEEAGPSMPVRITGLDEVPNADDKFFVVPDLALAREIAEQRRGQQRAAEPTKLATFRLEDLDKAKVTEVKLILKADVRGSIEAIKKEIEKLHHEEVRIKLLHAGIGGITEGDVQLALASPEDTLIIGFNVVPDDRAKSLADEKGVQIRQYEIIYQVTDDLRSALEGKLKPKEEVVHLGRAVVRNVFKISRVGSIAGCFVMSGTIERSARVRLIRDGVVIYPPPDRSATIESLKRFKDDVRSVDKDYECGIKIAGYDDLKVDDVIEAFRVDQVQRTL